MTHRAQKLQNKHSKVGSDHSNASKKKHAAFAIF